MPWWVSNGQWLEPLGNGMVLNTFSFPMPLLPPPPGRTEWPKAASTVRLEAQEDAANHRRVLEDAPASVG